MKYTRADVVRFSGEDADADREDSVLVVHTCDDEKTAAEVETDMWEDVCHAVARMPRPSNSGAVVEVNFLDTDPPTVQTVIRSNVSYSRPNMQAMCDELCSRLGTKGHATTAQRVSPRDFHDVGGYEAFEAEIKRRGVNVTRGPRLGRGKWERGPEVVRKPANEPFTKT